jgi:hypothetical protein
MLERLLDKLASRKFWVLVFASILLFFKAIDENIWLKIALFWMGIEGICDILRESIRAWKSQN